MFAQTIALQFVGASYVNCVVFVMRAHVEETHVWVCRKLGARSAGSITIRGDRGSDIIVWW